MIFQEGNTYLLEIPLTVDGDDIDINEISLVEFTFGNIRKIYGSYEEDGEIINGDVTYDNEQKQFLIPLSQEETFALNENTLVDYQARIKFVDGSVNGTEIQTGFLQKSISKKVL